MCQIDSLYLLTLFSFSMLSCFIIVLPIIHFYIWSFNKIFNTNSYSLEQFITRIEILLKSKLVFKRRAAMGVKRTKFTSTGFNFTLLIMVQMKYDERLFIKACSKRVTTFASQNRLMFLMTIFDIIHP